MNKYTYYFVIQGNYGYGWSDEDFETTYRNAIRSLKEYCANGIGTYRIIRRRERN